MAARLVRGHAAAPSGDHLRDQSALSGCRPDPLSGRRGSRSTHEPDRGGGRAQDPHGQPRHCRLAQHQRRGRDPLRAIAHNDGQRPGRDVSRALQQQDQRRHPAPLAAGGEPGARRHDHRRDRRRVGDRSQPIEQAQAACRRQSFPRRAPQGQARRQIAFCRLAQIHVWPDCRPGHHFRLPDQAHPRIQTTTAQCAAHCGAVQPAAGQPAAST